MVCRPTAWSATHVALLGSTVRPAVRLVVESRSTTWSKVAATSIASSPEASASTASSSIFTVYIESLHVVLELLVIVLTKELVYTLTITFFSAYGRS